MDPFPFSLLMISRVLFSFLSFSMTMILFLFYFFSCLQSLLLFFFVSCLLISLRSSEWSISICNSQQKQWQELDPKTDKDNEVENDMRFFFVSLVTFTARCCCRRSILSSLGTDWIWIWKKEILFFFVFLSMLIPHLDNKRDTGCEKKEKRWRVRQRTRESPVLWEAMNSFLFTLRKREESDTESKGK